METIYLGLGSNLGDRRDYIHRAIDLLSLNGIIINTVASLIETAPVGGPPQGKFLNTVLKGQTFLSAQQLLSLTQSIEQQLGRIRTTHNGPRTIDIDILLFGKQKIQARQLTVPHPRMHERNFVMQPLMEIAPELKDSAFFSSRETLANT